MTDFVWKTLRFKHILEAQQVEKGLETGETSEADLLGYVCSLLVSWPFNDVDTGEPIPCGDIGELTPEQIKILYRAFSQATNGEEVPKQNAGQ